MKKSPSAKERSKERKKWLKMDAAVSQICNKRAEEEFLNEYNDCMAGYAKIYQRTFKK